MSINRNAIDESKLAPSAHLYGSESQPAAAATTKSEVLQTIKKLMKPETVTLFAKRHEEGFDVEGDQLYDIWSKLKSLSIEDTSPRSKNVEIPDKPTAYPPTYRVLFPGQVAHFPWTLPHFPGH